MGLIDDAIIRLQQIAQSCVDMKIKGAPAYPTDSASVLPMSIAYIASGQGAAQSAGDAQLNLNINVDIMVSLAQLKGAYTQINAVIPEYLKRLAGDPTLAGKTTTIIYPVTFEVLASQWNVTDILVARFTIPMKFRETSIT